MKKIDKSFAILLAGVFAFGLSSCEKDGVEVKELTLSTYDLAFSFEGDTKIVAVISETEWNVTVPEDVTWLTVEKTSDDEFTVIAKENVFATERAETVTVTNLAETKNLTAIQSGAQNVDPGVEFFSGSLTYNGSYYGRDTGNFFIQLFSEPDARDALKNGYYLELDFAAPAFPEGSALNIAPGEYKLTYEFEPYTVVTQPIGMTNLLPYENSVLLVILPAMGGTVYVQGDETGYNMIFELTLADGTEFRGSFNQPMVAANNVDSSIVPKDDFKAGSVTGSVAEFDFLGEYFKNGTFTWTLTAHSSTVGVQDDGTYTGDGYVLTSQFSSFMEGEGAYLPDAMYAIVGDVTRAPTAMKGYTSQAGVPGGTWLRKIEADVVTQERPVIVGTITTTRSGDEYMFTLDGVDETGAYIEGTFTGNANITSSVGE